MSTAVAERKRARKPKKAELCTELTKAGRPCTRRRKAGMTVCASHAGTARRPTHFTPEVRAKVVEALKAGVPRETAATHAGISDSALSDYLGRGRKAVEAGLQDDYSQFLEEVLKAEAGLEILLVGRVVSGSKDDPRLGLELASRKWPERYGRRDMSKVEHSGTVGVEAMLGGQHPFQLTRRTRERIIALIDEEAEGTIEGTAEEID